MTTSVKIVITLAILAGAVGTITYLAQPAPVAGLKESTTPVAVIQPTPSRGSEVGTSPSTVNTNPSTITPPSVPAPTTPKVTTFTMADVAKHSSAASCYTTVDGSVYNLTPFIGQHPGGQENIMKICGVDGSSLFSDQHGGQRRPANELASLKIGTLAK